jgi:hypothetical protein
MILMGMDDDCAHEKMTFTGTTNIIDERAGDGEMVHDNYFCDACGGFGWKAYVIPNKVEWEGDIEKHQAAKTILMDKRFNRVRTWLRANDDWGLSNLMWTLISKRDECNEERVLAAITMIAKDSDNPPCRHWL